MDASIQDEEFPEATPLPRELGLDETTFLSVRPSAVRALPAAASSAIGIRTSDGRVFHVPAPVAVIALASLTLAAGLAVFDPSAMSAAMIEQREASLLRWENADRERLGAALDALEPELRELRHVALRAGIVPENPSSCAGAPADHLAGHLREAALLTDALVSRTQESAALDLIPSRSPIDLASSWVIAGGPTMGGVHVSSNMGTRSDPFTGAKKRHQGLDLAAPAGTLVHAPSSATVEFAGSVPPGDDHARALLGNHVMLKHGDSGYYSLYAHLEKVSVKAGQALKAGDPIGTVGSTGRSTAPHLHYQVMRGTGATRENVDPLFFITDAVLIRDGRDVWYVPQSTSSSRTAQVVTPVVKP